MTITLTDQELALLRRGLNLSESYFRGRLQRNRIRPSEYAMAKVKLEDLRARLERK